MLKATLLDSKPATLFAPAKDKKGISVESITAAMQELGLKYRKVDEIDIYNILSLLKEKK